MPDIDRTAPLYFAFSPLHDEVLPEPSPLRAAITAVTRRDESEAVRALLATQENGATHREAVAAMARHLVEGVRARRARASGVDALMHEFSLSSQEGIALMCLAEALLRIPDRATADRLIADKISKGDWRRHLGESPSLFVNAAAWGLMITGRLVATSSEHGLSSAITRLIAKGGEPLIRKGVDVAMRLLGDQFVTGQTIEEALTKSRKNEARGYRYSYDMLGEAALTEHDAQAYFEAYRHAIEAIGAYADRRGIREGPGISIKLSALHPRYSRAQRARVMAQLLPRLKSLALLARQYDIGLNIDAEEAERLELSLDLLEALAFDEELTGFEGLGFVVQAYQKRCPFVIDWLIDLAQRSGRKLMVRLVKGAYWDAEIKRAQVDGLPGFPVYTRKAYTDVSYLVCAEKLLKASEWAYPQFATHNAHTLASIYQRAQQLGVSDYEFQCLHGMGEALYDQVVGPEHLHRPCRIYAPVGSHETLLAYLVRRLLENGANTSFVHRVVDAHIPIDELIADPFELASRYGGAPHPAIALPAQLFGQARKNSNGLDLASEACLRDIDSAMQRWGRHQWRCAPLPGADCPAMEFSPVVNPADARDIVGYVCQADESAVQLALQTAQHGLAAWQALGQDGRSAVLLRAADLFEAHRLELMALAVREAGKTLSNALGEVREAVDFLRYYASQASLQPPAAPLGVVASISPWNFPLAIFTGQLSAALACGNAVLAKPAEQTPLIAARALQLLHEAGVPGRALQLLPGSGETVGAALVADQRVDGVLFTGSTAVAQLIHRTLAKRSRLEGREIALIAETGGQNAMIVDSSALPEQVVQDVLVSAFDSAGQRCSALRVLCLQDDIADKTMAMLKGAMQELALGNPDRLSIDVGPVIDRDAQHALLAYIQQRMAAGHAVHSLELPLELQRHGTFVAPAVIEIDSIAQLQGEVFGPVLHVLRYAREELPQLVMDINATGYGLTMGVHTRIDETIAAIAVQAHVGNLYVNRSMIGAVVGVQCFGGEGLSGTGPKAGGPLYLKRLQRQASNELDSVTCQGLQPGTPTPGIDPFLAWLQAQGCTRLAQLARGYRDASLYGATVTLLGPTGERNTLFFAERGALWCAGPSREGVLNQIAAALATGNRVLLMRTQAAVPDLPSEIAEQVGWIEPGREHEAALQGVLAEPGTAASLRERMAAREGPLVPVIEVAADQPAPLWRLLAERAVCINTTAAGGNASLMALGQ